MPPRYLLPAFFLVLFLGAMVLGPLIYFGMELIKPIPFHRAMDRGLLVSAIVAMALTLARMQEQAPWSWSILNWRRNLLTYLKTLWPWNRASGLQLLLGYVMAAVAAQAIIGFDSAFSGFTSTHLDAHEAWNRVLMALIAALLVPPLEETVFRGFLQTELSRGLGWYAGWISAALFFMIAHFLKISPDIDSEPVHLWSGVSAVGDAFLPVIHGEFISGRGLNLFLLGLILGGLFLRAGTLWVNAGLHSGLILAVLLFTGFEKPIEPPRISYLGGDILSNPITSAVFVLLGFWIWRFYRHPSVLPETGANAP
jgi:membrane protease YdiL (CAAX protease family)